MRITAKYPNKPLADRFNALLNTYIIPNACQTNTDTFRGELASFEVQTVFKSLATNLQKIFATYSSVEEEGQPCLTVYIYIYSFIYSASSMMNNGM